MPRSIPSYSSPRVSLEGPRQRGDAPSRPVLRWARFIERRLAAIVDYAVDRAVRRVLDERLTDLNRDLLETYATRPMEPYLDIEDVATVLKVSKRKAEQLVAAGDLAPCWVGGQRRFHRDAVDAFVRVSKRAKR